LGHDSLMALHSIMFFRQPCRALAGKHPPTRLAAIERDGAPTLRAPGARPSSVCFHQHPPTRQVDEQRAQRRCIPTLI
jgi:hypothetical protein